MLRVFLAAMGIIILLAWLLAIVAGSAQAGDADAVPADDAGRTGDAVWVCLALVGGAALLAGAVWVGMLRRMPS